MDIQLQAIIYAVMAMTSFGFVNGMAKGLSDRLGALRFIVFRNIFLVLTLLPIVAYTWSKSTLDLEYIFYSILVSIAGYLGYYFFIRGIEIGKVGIIDPVASSRILITLFFGLVFFGDNLSNIQIGSVFVVFFGIVLLGIDIKEIRNSRLLDKKSGIHFALLAAVIWGVSMPLFSEMIEVIGAYFFTLILETTVLMVPLLQIFRSRNELLKISSFLKSKDLLPIAAVGIISAFGSLFLQLGYETQQVSIVSSVSAGSALVSGIFAAIVYKERLKPLQYFGAVMVVLGIVCIAYFRV